MGAAFLCFLLRLAGLLVLWFAVYLLLRAMGSGTDQARRQIEVEP